MPSQPIHSKIIRVTPTATHFTCLTPFLSVISVLPGVKYSRIANRTRKKANGNMITQTYENRK